VLVGASLGGLLALAAATDVRPAALVLVNPLPPAPLHALLPTRGANAAVVHWRRNATLAGTRRALPDADDATCLYAWRRWRDESGAVLDEALAGIALPTPPCPALVLASRHDSDVPAALSRRLAEHLQAQFLVVDASHVGPLLGRACASSARLVAAWLKPVAR
jgi:pimeloyl-ACP methyl ester carboxylesterase